MSRRPVVAIDGPAGSGKSTVAKLLARRLGFTHINTGALYRGVALLAIRDKISLDDEAAVVKRASLAKLEFRLLAEGNILHIDGNNVGEEILSEEAGQAASKVSAYPAVRALLLGFQKDLGRNGGVVLEGRDIGTVVFPQAEWKFFLTASLAARAERRSRELAAKGESVDLVQIQQQMAMRDKLDSERPISPLRQAPDALVLDTSSLSIESVLDQLESLVKASPKGRSGEARPTIGNKT